MSSGIWRTSRDETVTTSCNFWKRLLEKKLDNEREIERGVRNIYSFLQFYSILLNLSWISLLSFIPLPCKGVKDAERKVKNFFLLNF